MMSAVKAVFAQSGEEAATEYAQELGEALATEFVAQNKDRLPRKVSGTQRSG